MKYKIPGIGGRNKYKGNKPLPLSLMKDDKYPKIKMWFIKDDDEIIRDTYNNLDDRIA